MNAFVGSYGYGHEASQVTHHSMYQNITICETMEAFADVAQWNPWSICGDYLSMYRNSRMYNFLLHLNKQPKSTILFRPFIKLSFRLRPSEIYSSLFGISSFLMEGVIFKIGWVQEIKETHSKQWAQTVGGITCSD